MNVDQALDCPATEERDVAKTLNGTNSILADIANCINYGSWQNSVPLVRSLAIKNHSSETKQRLRLEFATSPGFTRKKSWQIDRIGPGELLTIRDRDIRLDPSYLSGLNEAERGAISLRLFDSDELVEESLHDIRVLACDEWGGMESMGELLGAFVMPNDPAVAKIIKSAAEILAESGHPAGLDGYQSRDPRRSYMLAAALWSAVAARSITYANPPSSFEKVGQKIRRPSTILADGLATCLDSSLLFAAAIEAVGLNPAILMTEGHCFVGCG